MFNKEPSSLSPLTIPVPMTKEQFAQQCGLTAETINQQVHRGYLPVIKVGRRVLIDTFTLAAQCLEKNHKPAE